MIVAPELFTPERAMNALHLADSALRGPLGMKTLDPGDQQYRPDYDNAEDGTDQSVAKGWNVSAVPHNTWLTAPYYDHPLTANSITKDRSGVSRSDGS